MGMENRYLVYGKAVYDSEQQEFSGNSMVIQGDRIVQIGEWEDLRQEYSTLEVLDYRELYLLPGLVNTHVHLEFPPEDNTYQCYMAEDQEAHQVRARKAARELLLSGVTSARDAGSSPFLAGYVDSWLGPRIQCSGVPLTVSNGHLAFLGKTADTKEELIEAVHERYEAGSRCIKVIASGGQMTPGSVPEQDVYSREEIAAAVEEAHKLGLRTVAHCLTVGTYENAMTAGVDCIEHCACFVRNKRLGLLERRYEPNRMMAFAGDHRFFMSGYSNLWHKVEPLREKEKSHLTDVEIFLLEQKEQEAMIVRKLVEAGMVLTVGTDAGCGRTYFHETWLELRLLTECCGFTPRQVIHAATVQGAESLGWEADIGKLKAGYRADFIGLRKNPLQDIEAFQRVEQVVCGGVPVRR